MRNFKVGQLLRLKSVYRNRPSYSEPGRMPVIVGSDPFLLLEDHEQDNYVDVLYGELRFLFLRHCVEPLEELES